MHACMNPQRSAVEFAVAASSVYSEPIMSSILKLMQAKLYADNEISTPGEMLQVICMRPSLQKPTMSAPGS